ncbi:sensor histidine kinase [Actinocorallia longicatena]|uniref:Signal transduction histidine kinase subgroup 3 dimerisation and phosphoacceptor domain-containing protein n=1 Tax=Actinocorallia longicatena TaxID=111803 RepID=A0ABP6QI93_9ACTN
MDDGAERFARARKILLRTYDLTAVAIGLAFGFGALDLSAKAGPAVAAGLTGLALWFLWRIQRMTRDGLQGTAAVRDVVVNGVVAAGLTLVMFLSPGWFMVAPFWAAAASLALRSTRQVAALCAATAAFTALPVTLTGDDVGWYSWPVTTLLLAIVTGLSAFTYLSGKWLMEILREAEIAQESQARLAVTEERLRIARDLHDLLGHQLSLIAVKTELAIRVVPVDAGRAQEELRDVQRSARSALREVRATIRGYRDPSLDGELVSVGGVLAAAGTACDFPAVPPELPAEQGTVLAWVVREAATNVLKHSRARNCSITLVTTASAVTLTVRNDGVPRRAPGDIPGDDGPGDGLAGLSSRVEAVGGRLSAGPEEPGCFAVVAELPLVPVQSLA